jgi:hypothetical protein
MDARPSGGGAEEIFGCNEKVGVPEFLTGTSPGGLGIARTPERTSPIRRPPLDTCGRAGRTPQPGSPAQCCVAGRSGHFLGKVQISHFLGSNGHKSNKFHFCLMRFDEAETAFVLGSARLPGVTHNPPRSTSSARSSPRGRKAKLIHTTT